MGHTASIALGSEFGVEFWWKGHPVDLGAQLQRGCHADPTHEPATMSVLDPNVPGRPVAMFPPGFPTDDEILSEIRNILATANLMSITKKQGSDLIWFGDAW